ncbi:Unknown protein sequence [Pseudomonas amygdali pv. lachrymans]|uniref:Uncharacterized protein n=1 Tax=Pseudomonas amygdali pv. lachrymans TaxID=53707 RepID=A0ABR5KSV1_PSEAV|nr:Unknown protein sequence [Pseudomonas amygdali pv. lachrymans]KPC17886.1 Unknown protein sequence [Pseudomonas amygdali pv. lachrymans]
MVFMVVIGMMNFIFFMLESTKLTGEIIAAQHPCACLFID